MPGNITNSQENRQSRGEKPKRDIVEDTLNLRNRVGRLAKLAIPVSIFWRRQRALEWIHVWASCPLQATPQIPTKRTRRKMATTMPMVHCIPFLKNSEQSVEPENWVVVMLLLVVMVMMVQILRPAKTCGGTLETPTKTT